MVGDAQAARDRAFMTRALALAERGRGRTSPNPMVGAVLVSPDGVVVGAGYHKRAGGPHAEVHALRQAGSLSRGATLYVTLEPCCHRGRTGPCAPALVEAGVRRVVAAIEDPNPLVGGGGIRHLRDHGVAVEVGVGRAAAHALNRPFFVRLERARPYVVLKVATSLDGCIAAAPGRRTPLSSARANLQVQRLRAEVDAIAVGVETVRIDDPLLTVRALYRPRPLVRVVLDRHLRTPPDARLFATRGDGPVLVATGRAAATAHPDRVAELARVGAEVLALEETALPAVLTALAARGVSSLLLEGGARVHAAAWRAGVVDRVVIIVTPAVLGPGGVRWSMPPSWSVTGLRDVRVSALGPDVLIEGDVHWPDRVGGDDHGGRARAGRAPTRDRDLAGPAPA